MKQRLTRCDEFFNIYPERARYDKLAETELKVQRLEHIIEGLLFWREDTQSWKKVRNEYLEYVDSDD